MRTSRRHEQLLPSQFTAISRDDELVPDLFLFSFFPFFPAKDDRMRLCKDLDLDALGGKRRFEHFADQRVFTEEQPVAGENGHPASQSRECLSQFDRDRGRADTINRAGISELASASSEVQ